jgi:hypothetical protein
MIGIVTATTDIARASKAIAGWNAMTASEKVPVHVVINGSPQQPYLGVVPAFRQGVDQLLKDEPGVDIIACFHDDLELLDPGWDTRVQQTFDRYPDVGLVGFSGAIGLGTDDLYQAPYDPMQLARIGFRSNLVDAETHGARSLVPEMVVCCDGFSLIGRRAFFLGASSREFLLQQTSRIGYVRPWTYLEHLGFIHHFYDGALGCLARRLSWQVRYLPVRCHHLGGQTAVGDPGYQRWAALEIDGGDRGFWEAAHRIGYDTFRDVLPLRLR